MRPEFGFNLVQRLHARKVVEDIDEANLLVTSKKYYRQKPRRIVDAEMANLPIYVLRGNSTPQIRQFLGVTYHLDEKETESFESALKEAEEAVDRLRSGEETVELTPQTAYIRRLQHLVAERSHVASQSTGKEPTRRVRIFKEKAGWS